MSHMDVVHVDVEVAISKATNPDKVWYELALASNFAEVSCGFQS